MTHSRLLAIVGLMSVSLAAGAQIQPLPTNPLGQPTLAKADPLVITEAPTGVVYTSMMFGQIPTSIPRPANPIYIATHGGKGAVTLSLEVQGPRPEGIRLVEPAPVTNAVGATLATGAASTLQARVTAERLSGQASDERKELLISGYSQDSGPLPANNTVTIVARDSSGTEVRRQFVVTFTRAAGKATLNPNPRVSRQAFASRDSNLPAGLQGAEVETAQTEVALVATRPGAPLEWSPDDPKSEVICVYGSARFVCEASTFGMRGGNEPGSRLAREIKLYVPDINRGNQVQIFLRNPYGDSDPVTIQLDNKTTITSQQKLFLAGPANGILTDHISPARADMYLLKNGTTRACGQDYLVWDKATTDGKMYLGGTEGPFLNLKFAGDATARVVSVPVGSVITNAPAQSWAKMEFRVPASVLASYVYNVEMSYFTRQGECPNKRR